jgi:hypothetical protein
VFVALDPATENETPLDFSDTSFGKAISAHLNAITVTVVLPDQSSTLRLLALALRCAVRCCVLSCAFVP